MRRLNNGLKQRDVIFWHDVTETYFYKVNNALDFLWKRYGMIMAQTRESSKARYIARHRERGHRFVTGYTTNLKKNDGR